MNLGGIHIEIRGTVQGVGYRPWVFQLARRMDIRGAVRNDSRGVSIDAARAVVAANLNEHLRPSDFDAPVTRERRATHYRLFRHRVVNDAVGRGEAIAAHAIVLIRSI